MVVEYMLAMGLDRTHNPKVDQPNPMPVLGVRWRPWALESACLRASSVRQRQLASVGVVTVADTEGKLWPGDSHAAKQLMIETNVFCRNCRRALTV